jgi:hypothetical protein
MPLVIPVARERQKLHLCKKCYLEPLAQKHDIQVNTMEPQREVSIGKKK